MVCRRAFFDECCSSSCVEETRTGCILYWPVRLKTVRRWSWLIFFCSVHRDNKYVPWQSNASPCLHCAAGSFGSFVLALLLCMVLWFSNSWHCWSQLNCLWLCDFRVWLKHRSTIEHLPAKLTLRTVMICMRTVEMAHPRFFEPHRPWRAESSQVNFTHFSRQRVVLLTQKNFWVTQKEKKKFFSLLGGGSCPVKSNR